jgi:hypothetical protein
MREHRLEVADVFHAYQQEFLPEQLAPLALRNQRLLYDLLFRAASEALLEIAADPRQPGGTDWHAGRAA